MPKVSVIIPTYQHAEFLADAIDSVLAQTYKDYELIIVDDGSTDGTREIAARYINRIKCIYQDNKGLAAARNTGILASKGEYIGLLDADDVWLPNKLEVEVQSLDAHPSVGLVYSNYTYFGSRAGSRRSGFEEISPVAGHPIKELLLSNPIISSAILIRKSCFDKAELFDESLRQCEDLDMWLRIAKHFEIDYIRVPLASYRLHDKNMHLDTKRNAGGWVAVLEKSLKSNLFLSGGAEFRKMEELYYRALGSWHLSFGKRQEARKIYWKYIRLYPHSVIAYISWLMTLLPKFLISWIGICRQKLTRQK